MGIKSTKFDADIESVEKVAKNACEKSNQPKKGQKNGVFYFYFCVQKVFGL
jgi:hypothetical protein